MKPEVIREIAEKEAGGLVANAKHNRRILRAALRILEQAGYVVTPKEPTEEMIEAARNACDYQEHIGRPTKESLRKALLAALTQEGRG